MSSWVADPDEWLRVNREYNARYNPESFYWRAQNPSIAFSAAEVGEYGLYGDLVEQVYKVSKDLFRQNRLKTTDYEQVNFSTMVQGRRNTGPMPKRARTSEQDGAMVTDNTHPGRDNLGYTKTVTVGDKPLYTTSKTKRKIVSGKKGSQLKSVLNKVVHTNLFRWQSIRPFSNVDQGIDIRSLLLTPQVARSVANQALTLAMPMYAFDLSTIPVQGLAGAATKTGFKYESVPMYRLYKDVFYPGVGATAAYALNQNVTNYYWKPQNGLNNGPGSQYLNTCDYLWHPEYQEEPPGDVCSHQDRWTSVDVLLKCSRKENCVVHFSTVMLRDDCGPDREYCYDQAWDGNANMATSKKEHEPVAQTHEVDAFWESFWDSKLAHPLAEYHTKKHDFIRFLGDDKITVRAMDGDDGGLVKPYTHKKSIVYGDGSWTDHYRYATDDSTSATLRQPPVYTAYGGGENDMAFDYGYGYNCRKRYADNEDLYDAAPSVRNNNKWLLIWMENRVPPDDVPGYKMAVGDDETKAWEKFNRPMAQDSDENPINLDPYCCSFDIKVKKCIDTISL